MPDHKQAFAKIAAIFGGMACAVQLATILPELGSASRTGMRGCTHGDLPPLRDTSVLMFDQTIMKQGALGVAKRAAGAPADCDRC